jgi:protein-tyrosine phosphatase
MVGEMMFSDLIAQKAAKGSLKPTEIRVRTKDGQIFSERIVDGNPITTQVGTAVFIPIEGAPDPEVCKIIDYLYLGSQDAATNKEELIKQNVRHILNVATGISSAFPNEFVYHNVEIMDLDEEPITKYFTKCFEIIQVAISKKEGILVHCNAGVSRSATIVVAYLMFSQRLSYSKAYTLVKEKRPKINPNPGFVNQLIQYEKTLQLSSS